MVVQAAATTHLPLSTRTMLGSQEWLNSAMDGRITWTRW